MRLLKIVLTILVPPVGLFLEVGLSATLLINILLTLLGWLPGVVHAFWVMSKRSDL